MTPSIPRSVTAIRVGAALLLTALGLLAPADRAVAGCGEYVMIGGQPGTHDPVTDHRSPGQPGPSCSGPACTRPTPAPTPFSPGQVRLPPAPDGWAESVAATVIDGHGSPFPRTPSLGTPTDRPQPVFHPPR
jgi:hypothetical protein